MARSIAMTEAYANVPHDDYIFECLILDHITFAESIRIVANATDDTTLGGQLYKAIPVSVTLPGSSEDGPTPARISIDNVSRILVTYLREAVNADSPIKVTYRAYLNSDRFTLGDEITDLELWDVEVTATTAEGSLRYRELELQAFPLATYDAQYYPTLQGG
jgi:hypothetical protein